MEEAERVGEAATEQRGHLATLAVGETGVLTVCFRIFEVYLFVCHIEVAAHDNRLCRVEAHEVVTEVIFPFGAVVETSQPVLGVGCVDRYEVEVCHLERYDTSFVVVLVDA